MKNVGLYQMMNLILTMLQKENILRGLGNIRGNETKLLLKVEGLHHPRMTMVLKSTQIRLKKKEKLKNGNQNMLKSTKLQIFSTNLRKRKK